MMSEENFSLGDRVRILWCIFTQHVGKFGTIVRRQRVDGGCWIVKIDNTSDICNCNGNEMTKDPMKWYLPGDHVVMKEMCPDCSGTCPMVGKDLVIMDKKETVGLFIKKGRVHARLNPDMWCNVDSSILDFYQKIDPVINKRDEDCPKKKSCQSIKFYQQEASKQEEHHLEQFKRAQQLNNELRAVKESSEKKIADKDTVILSLKKEVEELRKKLSEKHEMLSTACKDCGEGFSHQIDQLQLQINELEYSVKEMREVRETKEMDKVRCDFDKLSASFDAPIPSWARIFDEKCWKCARASRWSAIMDKLHGHHGNRGCCDYIMCNDASNHGCFVPRKIKEEEIYW